MWNLKSKPELDTIELVVDYLIKKIKDQENDLFGSFDENISYTFNDIETIATVDSSIKDLIWQYQCKFDLKNLPNEEDKFNRKSFWTKPKQIVNVGWISNISDPYHHRSSITFYRDEDGNCFGCDSDPKFNPITGEKILEINNEYAEADYSGN